jgi:hypothetical protein
LSVGRAVDQRWLAPVPVVSPVINKYETPLALRFPLGNI